MSIKSYTLADGTTATVNATENGVPFNEGMGVLTKAIKASINSTSSGTGGSGSSKQIATLACSQSTVMTPSVDNVNFTYNGDGTLKTTVGTI